MIGPGGFMAAPKERKKFEVVCEVCGQGPEIGIAIYRTGGKGPGVNPHWRCDAHIEKKGRKP